MNKVNHKVGDTVFAVWNEKYVIHGQIYSNETDQCGHEFCVKADHGEIYAIYQKNILSAERICEVLEQMIPLIKTINNMVPLPTLRDRDDT